MNEHKLQCFYNPCFSGHEQGALGAKEEEIWGYNITCMI